MKGCFHQTAQGRTSYEIYEAESDFLLQIAAILKARFGFQATSSPLEGLDVIYWDFVRGEIPITVGWDNWSGCFVFAETEEGDEIVREIGQYLEETLNENIPKSDRP